MLPDSYNIPAAAGEALYKDKGSKFYAFAYRVFSEDEIKTHLHELKKKYPDASHHCFAWVLHPDKSAQRASDAGEPANTAGKPILRQIISSDLTNTLVVVVRYFGGTLLGAGGLINAYGEAARLAIEAAGIEQKQVEAYFTARYNYEVENDIFRFIRTVGGNIKSIDKKETVVIEFSVLKKNFEKVKTLWNDFRNFELDFNGYK